LSQSFYLLATLFNIPQQWRHSQGLNLCRCRKRADLNHPAGSSRTTIFQ
jgi:hypothetical protein